MLADLHLHFEGCVPVDTLVAIAARNLHAFGVPGAFERALESSRESGSFLRLFADCCRAFAVAHDYAEAATALGMSLSRELGHAEIYVSPEIWRRFGLAPAEILHAIDGAFARVERETGCRLFLLLDSVRQWGPDAAQRVLDLHESAGLPRVVGFGVGGDEASVPAARFRDVYERAKRLGLGTSLHAGEWRGPESVKEGVDELPLDRIDHGVRAAEDRPLLARLARMKIPLCVAPSSNVSTGVCRSLREHPLPRILDAGVRACLSADDSTIFDTSTQREYEIARREFGLDEAVLSRLRKTALESRFGR